MDVGSKGYRSVKEAGYSMKVAAVVIDDQSLSILLGIFPLYLPLVQSLLALITLSFSLLTLIQRLPTSPTMCNVLLFY